MYRSVNLSQSTYLLYLARPYSFFKSQVKPHSFQSQALLSRVGSLCCSSAPTCIPVLFPSAQCTCNPCSLLLLIDLRSP